MISYHGKYIKLTRQNMWTRNDLFLAVNLATEFSNLVIDSRAVQKNDIFIGIQGLNHDGSSFAKQAIENGAALCITHFIPENCKEFSNKFLVVKNTYDILVLLAKYNREKKFKNTKFIGVTGSVGKTTTKEMLYHVLQKSYANGGNLNNQYGLPLSLANMIDCDYGIFEMGMSAKSEIAHLSKILQPNIGIITGIAPAHMEFFTNLNDIATAKSEILSGMKSGYLIVNFDSPAIETILQIAMAQEDIRIIGYSTHNISYDIFGKILIKTVNIEENHANIYTEVCSEYSTNDGRIGKIHYKIGGIGNDLVMNSSAVLATLIATNDNIDLITSLESFVSLNGRGNVINIDNLQIQLINDTYNSNPTSVAVALERIKYLSQNRKIAILGDMLELGDQEIEMHRNLVQQIILNNIDKVFCVGHRMKYLFDELHNDKKGLWCETSNEMAEKICNHVQPLDTIMVKGSNSMKMMIICDALISYK